MEDVCRKFSKYFDFKDMLSKYNIYKYIVFILCLPFIFYIRKVNYLLSHSIIETLDTAICFSLVITVINSYKMSKNNYFLFLGIVFGFVSLFNFLHGVTYIDIIYNGKESINISLQLSTAFRLVEVLSILISFIFLYKNFNKDVVGYFYIFLSLFLLYIIFFTNYFPTCFITGLGNTKFYVQCEYMSILCMLLATILFVKNKKHFSKTTVFYMSAYLILSMLVRYMFVVNNSIYNDFNVLIHILKFICYYFLYKALVENVIKNPLNALFNDLNNKNIELELKTIELEKTISKLNEEKLKVEKINEELKVSKNNYKKLIEFLPDAVIFRHNYKIVYANAAAVKLFGAKDKQQLLGKTPFELTHGDYLDDLTKKLEDQKNGITPTVNFGEYKLISLDGKIKDAEFKSTCLEPKEDNYYLSVIYDNLERKKAEKAIKLLNEAKENEKLKTEFFANLSHEIRTPINVIYSALQVLELNSKDEFTKKYNAIIKQNCCRLLRLVNNIIDSTKIDDGFLKLNLTCNNIVSVVENIGLSVSNYIELHDMTLIFDTDVEEKYLNFDLDAIERIILNLISNAVKFRRENGTININIFDKGNSIIICVKDDGIGISAEQQSFIFEKFKQVDKSFTRNTEGSGIGLSLVKSLVELHKGTITLKSKEGVGSEFIIELPIFAVSQHCVKNNDEIFQSNIIEKINIEFSDIYL
ncbi:MASE3 domain-containing sensor histidine kinase [Romboutsia sp.]|uniref:sensor histidine kinase n=1 Tax=Romboutsia sp. TaxID=1965302 RepID=UPI002BB5AB82|nr:MASE3 domain-containing protein [Romboutsia sp.]HSQ90377.1 MASE3 domain-containing protein [Romboutsia sp.]